MERSSDAEATPESAHAISTAGKYWEGRSEDEIFTMSSQGRMFFVRVPVGMLRSEEFI